MSEQDVETIRGAYDDFNSGNPPGVLEILVEDVVWVEPGGGNAPSGTFNSPQSVGDDVFSTIPQYFDEFRADPENFDDQGDRVVVTGRTGEGPGVPSTGLHLPALRPPKSGRRLARLGAALVVRGNSRR